MGKTERDSILWGLCEAVRNVANVMSHDLTAALEMSCSLRDAAHFGLLTWSGAHEGQRQEELAAAELVEAWERKFGSFYDAIDAIEVGRGERDLTPKERVWVIRISESTAAITSISTLIGLEIAQHLDIVLSDPYEIVSFALVFTSEGA